MRHIFEAEQWLPFPVPLVFAFFANPENLPRLMPPWQKARIEQATFAAPPPPPQGMRRFPGIAAGAGTRMTLSFRAVPFMPVRLAWDAVIDDFAWNDRFCDVQERGPFAHWYHCHHVTAAERDGVAGCLVRDRVEYAFPGGPLGDMANVLGGRWQIGSIFRYRHRRTAELVPRMAAALGGG